MISSAETEELGSDVVVIRDGTKAIEALRRADLSKLPRKERVFMGLYLRFGLSGNVELNLASITKLVYPEYFELPQKKRESLCGSVYQALRQLIAKGILKSSGNTPKYKLINNANAKAYVCYIAKKRFGIDIPREIVN